MIRGTDAWTAPVQDYTVLEGAALCPVHERGDDVTADLPRVNGS